MGKLTRYNPNLALVNVNFYAKFGFIPSIHSQDIERKQILTLIKGPKIVVNIKKKKMTRNKPNLDLI